MQQYFLIQLSKWIIIIISHILQVHYYIWHAAILLYAFLIAEYNNNKSRSTVQALIHFWLWRDGKFFFRHRLPITSAYSQKLRQGQCCRMVDRYSRYHHKGPGASTAETPFNSTGRHPVPGTSPSILVDRRALEIPGRKTRVFLCKLSPRGLNLSAHSFEECGRVRSLLLWR